MIQIITPKQLVTVKVEYYIPDYTHILNELVWQSHDQWPEIPRVHRFLNYWHRNIDAVIGGVYVQHSRSNWRAVKHEWTR